MKTILAFIKNHPVLTYFVLTLAISWAGFLLVIGGPGGFPGTEEQVETLLPIAVLAMLVGPSVAGLLLTGLVDGRAGLREVLSRLLRWRVGARWYAVALLPAPFLVAAVLFALSVSSPLSTTDDKASVLLSGIAAGLTTVLEELGWTGFATPRLRRRYGILTTGLIVGVLWGAWHLLQVLFVGGTYSGSLSLALFLPLYFFSASVAQLAAYRVLLVWVYDHTGSLFVATVMHASLTASTTIIFRPLATGMSFLTCTFGLAVALWVAVGAVAVARGGQLSQQPLTV
jgi:membrane protease YdiL (CAAX protease family)